MNLLLDTHIFLWLKDAPEELSASARSNDPAFSSYPVQIVS